MPELNTIKRFYSIDVYYFIVTFIVSLIGIIFYFFGQVSVLVVSVLIINSLFILKFLNKIPLFILFVYIFLHSKVFAMFYIWKIPISYWPDFQTNSIIGTVLISHLLFILVLGNSISHKKPDVKFDLLKIAKPNSKIFGILLVFAILILIFGLKGENVFQSGSYGEFDSVQKSTLHEYFILIFLFLIIYSPSGVFNKFIIRLLLFIYIIKTLIYGGRIEVVQISLLFFYCYYVFNDKIKTLYIVLLLFFGIYFNGVVSNIRSNPQILFSENYFDVFNPINVLEIYPKSDIISSTEGDVVQSSARIIGLVETGKLSSGQRIISFLSFLASPIIPQSYLPKSVNLATYKQDAYQSGGGGLISTFFYCWLGYFGPVLIALVIGFSIRKFYSFQSDVYFIYGLCLLSMFPRWFSYNPIFLVKFCIYAVLLLFTIKTGVEISKNKIK